MITNFRTAPQWQQLGSTGKGLAMLYLGAGPQLLYALTHCLDLFPLLAGVCLSLRRDELW